MDLLFIKIAGDMGESFPVSPAIFIYRELSTKNSNIKCEYAIISIMIHLYRGRIKHIKLLSKRGETHCIKTKRNFQLELIILKSYD